MNAGLLVVESWLIDFSCLATVLFGAALMMRVMLRDPGSRVMLAWGTWLAIATGGLLIAAPQWPRYGLSRLLPRRPMAAVVMAPEGDFQFVEPFVISEPPDAVLSPADVESLGQFSGTSVVPAKAREDVAAGPRWPRMLIAGWLASAAAATAWILAGFGQAWLRVKRSKRAPQWIADEFSEIAVSGRSHAEVRTSSELSSAVAIGTLKPRILLPEASAVESNAKAIRAALAHEWAHIRHGDLWLLALERALLPLLALHPLFWWLRRSTRLDQELLADAAAAGERPVEYAEALVAWAKAPASFNSGLAALAMWERPSNLSRRVQMILTNKQATNSWLWRICGGLAACAIVCAGAALSTVSVGVLGADDEPAVASGLVESPAKALGAAEPAEQSSGADDPAAPKSAEMAITLKVALLALDRGEIAEKTRKQVIEAVERLTGRPMYEAHTPSAAKNGGRTLTAEIDNDQSGDLALDIQSITGVKLLSRSKVITLDGQEAYIHVAEQGPIVTIEEKIDGEARRIDLMMTQMAHEMRIKPHALGNGSMLNLDVRVSSLEQHRIPPRSSKFKTAAPLGRTLIVVSSEPYAILITPVKVEPQVVSQSATSGERDIGFPILPVAPARPVRTEPATTAVDATPAAVRRGPTALLQLAQNAITPALVAPSPPPLPGSTPILGVPTLPTTPAAIPPVETVIQPLPSTTRQNVAQPIAAGANTGAEGRALFTIPIIENAREVAAKLRQRLHDLGIDGMEVSSDPRTNSVLVMGTFNDAREIPKRLSQLGATFNKAVGHELVEAGQKTVAVSSTEDVRELSSAKSSNQTHRKLLELDLQEAQVNVEAAEVELAMVQEMMKKNPNSVSRQEVRKRQLEVDRAKIQLKRIQVQLEAEKEVAEPVIVPPASTRPPTPRSR